MEPNKFDVDDVRHLFQVFFEKSENDLREKYPEMSSEQIREIVLKVTLEEYEEYK